MDEEQNRVGVVTGGSGRIGPSVAKRSASGVCAIALQYGGNSAKAEDVCAELKNAVAKVIVVKANITNATDVENCSERRLTCLAVSM
jgi:3-oxoacyl-[acyl-carrier protein] reductase